MRRGRKHRRWRDRILQSCRFRCVYCGRRKFSSLTLEHLVPRSQGGGSVIANLVAACIDCNRERGTMPLQDWISTCVHRRKAVKFMSAAALIEWAASRKLVAATDPEPNEDE